MDFDDPNLLISNSGVAPPPQTALVKLRSLQRNVPPWKEPPEKGFKILKKWMESPKGIQWNEDWDYIMTLDLDAYLYLFANFPYPFTGRLSKKKQELNQRINNYCRGVATWLLWLPHPDRVKPIELEYPALQSLKLDAEIENTRLRICQQIVDDLQCSRLFGNKGACLWFWTVVADTRQAIKLKGITGKPQNIFGKRELHKLTGEQLRYLQHGGGADKKISGLTPILNSLSAIVDHVSTEKACKDYIYKKAYHVPYTKLLATRRNKLKNLHSKQITYSISDEVTFTTGNGRRIPKNY